MTTKCARDLEHDDDLGSAELPSLLFQLLPFLFSLVEFNNALITVVLSPTLLEAYARNEETFPFFIGKYLWSNGEPGGRK